MRNKLINIIPALAVAAAIYAWFVEEVGVLVGVGDAAANRRPPGANGSAWPSKPLQAVDVGEALVLELARLKH